LLPTGKAVRNFYSVRSAWCTVAISVIITHLITLQKRRRAAYVTLYKSPSMKTGDEVEFDTVDFVELDKIKRTLDFA